MVDITITYTLGTVGMLLGTLLIAAGLDDERRTAPKRYYALLGVTGIATVAYAAMALGYGQLATGQGTVFVPRYVDWLLTTPLLILYVGLLGHARPRTLSIAVALDVVVIALGFGATLVAPPLNWVAFGVALLAFLGLVWVLTTRLWERPVEDARDDRALFQKLRNVIIVLWAIYPAVWLVGTPGLAVMTPPTMAVVIAYLDLLTKVGFGMIILNAHGAFDWLWAGDDAGSPAADGGEPQ